MSYNDGQLKLIPKIYENDDMCIVNNTTSWGLFTGHEYRFSLRSELLKQINLSNFVDISIVDDAVGGKVKFNK